MTFRERLQQQSAKQDEQELVNDNTPEHEERFSREFYGIESIRNCPPQVDLRMTDGKSQGIPYFSALFSYDAELGISIRTPDSKIAIVGRDLQLLYRYLLLNRVVYIQASRGIDIKEDGLFVEDISID